MYSFHPKSLVEIKKDETRLRFTSQEVTTWLDELGKSDQDLIFCFYLWKSLKNQFQPFCMTTFRKKFDTCMAGTEIPNAMLVLNASCPSFDSYPSTQQISKEIENSQGFTQTGRRNVG